MEFLEIGKVVNVQGLSGEIKIYAYTDDIEAICKLKKLYLEKDNEITEYIVVKSKFKANMLITKLKGINTVEEATKLRDYIVKRKREDVVLEQGAYYIKDLIGLDVFTIENKYLGKMSDVLQNGCADVYVIKDENNKEILLPAIKKVIKEIDIVTKKIIVEMMEGLE